jgi:rod shape-determining protein MreD
MRPARIALLAIAAVVLQITYLSGWRPWGIVPNLVLILVISLSLNATSSEALWVALGGGLALDFSSGTDFGLKTAVLVVIALGITYMRRSGTNLDSWWLELALVVAGSLVAALAVIAALVVGHVGLPVWGETRQWLVETLVNVGLAAILRPMLIWGLRQPMGTLAVRGGL